MKWDRSQLRTTPLSNEEYAVLSKDGFFLAPLTHMRRMETRYSSETRRASELESPPWYLFFKDRHYSKSRSFLHKTLSAMNVMSSNPDAFSVKYFHSETGVLSKYLVDYLRSIDDADKILQFISNFRAFALGEKKRMPRNISSDTESYNRLKTAVKTEYAQRLIGEYKARSLGSSNRTQDFAMLFRMPLYTLLETVFCSLDDDDVVRVVEEYRA